MGADSAVVNADVQQRHKQQRDGEHHIAKCDPCVDGEVLNSGHVERGREQGSDEVGHWDGLRDLGKVALVEEDEIVCSCNIAGPGEEEPGTRHQHAEVDQVEAVLGLHVTDRVSCMSVTMCTTTPAVLTQFQEHCAFYYHTLEICGINVLWVGLNRTFTKLYGHLWESRVYL